MHAVSQELSRVFGSLQSEKNSTADFRADPFVSDVIDRLVLPQTLLHHPKRLKLETFPERHDDRVKCPEEPCVLFATLANTYSDLICVDIGKDLSQAVGGFGDSVVRVYNLKGGRSGFQINGIQNRMSSILPRPRNKNGDIDSTLDSSGNVYFSSIAEIFVDFSFLQIDLGIVQMRNEDTILETGF